MFTSANRGLKSEEINIREPQSEVSDRAGDNIDARSDLKAALIYLIASIALALAGAVYEHFSFGVYSYYMIYAFAIPLVLGTMRFLLRYIRKTGAAAGHTTGRRNASGCDLREENDSSAAITLEESASGRSALSGTNADMMWHAAIITLTVGSILTGALAICGRPSSLTIVYPLAGAALIAASTVHRAVGR